MLTILGFLISSVVAEPSFPSAWWSGSRILGGKQKYVTTGVSTDKFVEAFSKTSDFLISHKENLSPEVVLLVVCDKLKNDDFMAHGAMKSIEDVIARAESSVLIPQTMAGDAGIGDILAASASLYLDDASDFESHTWFIDGIDNKINRHFSSVKAFLEDSSEIFSNGKTEFVLVSLPPESADKVVEVLDPVLHKLTSGKYLAGIISESLQAESDSAEESAPGARKLLEVKKGPVKKLHAAAVPAVPLITANTLRITPAILLGIILSFVMLIFLYVGFCGMMGLGVNDQFWDKEKADKGRPLLGKVEE